MTAKTTITYVDDTTSCIFHDPEVNVQKKVYDAMERGLKTAGIPISYSIDGTVLRRMVVYGLQDIRDMDTVTAESSTDARAT